MKKKMPKLRAGFVQRMFQRDHTVVWDGSVRSEEKPKTVSEPFRPRPDKPSTYYPSMYDQKYWRRRREIMKILEGE